MVWTGTGTVSPAEEGWKDTVRANAGELVTVAGYFGDASGKYVYHCHMLEHEDMGMMRQFVVPPGQIHDVMESMEDTGTGASDGPEVGLNPTSAARRALVRLLGRWCGAVGTLRVPTAMGQPTSAATAYGPGGPA